MKTIAFAPLISVEIIYSFDNKEQEMWSFDYFLEDVLMSEDKLVKDLITRPYTDDLKTLEPTFKVKLENGHEIVAYTNGRLRQFKIRMILGDKVRVEISPYDLSKGRITYRL